LSLDRKLNKTLNFGFHFIRLAQLTALGKPGLQLLAAGRFKDTCNHK
jgi:hypothetical protein